MSYVQNKSLRYTLSVCVISSIMIAGGCKSKKGSASSVEDVAVTINHKDYGEIGNLLRVPVRKVTEKDAELALKSIGLWEESKLLTWDSRSGSEGSYSFKNMSSTDKSGQKFSAKNVTIAGLHMDGETPVADLVDMAGLKFEGKDTSLTIDNIGMTKLTLNQNFTALGYIEDLLDVADDDSGVADDSDVVDDDLNLDADVQGLQSFVVSGVKGQSDDSDFNIASLGWGQDPEDAHLRFAAKDLLITSKDADAITIKLASANIRGLEPMDETTTKRLELNGQNSFTDLLTQNPKLGDVDIQGLDISSDFIVLSLPKLTQSTVQKGAITNVDFIMPELKITVQEQEELSPDIAQAMAMLKSLGFDEMVFSSKGHTQINEDTDVMDIKAVSLDLQEGFDLNYKGKLSGFSALQDFSVETSPEALQAKQDQFKVHDFAFSFEDKSIVDRGFNLASAMTGETPKNLRRQVNGMLALGSLAALTQDDGAIYSELARSLGQFLQDGGTFNVELNPEAPLSLRDFEGLSGGQKPDLRRFGLSSSTTK